MGYTLAEAKIRLGIDPADTSQDADIEIAMNTALAMVEQYLNRQFLYAQEELEVIHSHGGSIQVSRYPIDTVSRMSPMIRHQVHNEVGLIVFHRPTITDRVELEYTGGYKVLPADLEYGLWLAFDAIWADMSAPAGSGGGSAGAAGDVESVSLTGVGTVRFSSGASSGSSSNNSGVAALEDLLGPLAVQLFRPYKLERA
jgi:hypothetical protein